MALVEAWTVFWVFVLLCIQAASDARKNSSTVPIFFNPSVGHPHNGAEGEALVAWVKREANKMQLRYGPQRERLHARQEAGLADYGHDRYVSHR